MKTIIGVVGSIFLIGLIYYFIKKKSPLKPAPLSNERRKYLADQYKSQLDGIFQDVVISGDKLNAAIQAEVDRLLDKLLQLGYRYEVPDLNPGYAGGDNSQFSNFIK